MSQEFNLVKFIRKIWREDLRVIFTFLFVILFIGSMFALMMGVLSVGNRGSGIRTPSVGFIHRADQLDTDQDLLPDKIEGSPDFPCEKGDAIFHGPTDPVFANELMGYCTGTDYERVDTDRDGFTDAVEDNIGTNPNNWFSPGFVYIIMAIYIIGFMSTLAYRGDPLKEYVEFEETSQSAGVSGKEGKYAYGGSSVFGTKKASDASEEERKAAIQQDARFQRMTAEGGAPRQQVKIKRNWGVLGLQFAIAMLFAIFMFVVFRLSQGG